MTERLVRVKVYETITSELEHAFAIAAINAANEHNLLNLLFDVRGVTNVTSPIDHYDMAYRQLTPTPLDHRARIAILKSGSDHSHDFVKTVLLNAGYLCEFFHDEDAALAWLDQ